LIVDTDGYLPDIIAKIIVFLEKKFCSYDYIKAEIEKNTDESGQFLMEYEFDHQVVSG
jgi:hypothetical protein